MVRGGGEPGHRPGGAASAYLRVGVRVRVARVRLVRVRVVGGGWLGLGVGWLELGMG